jgi:hypothetical protein
VWRGLVCRCHAASGCCVTWWIITTRRLSFPVKRKQPLLHNDYSHQKQKIVVRRGLRRLRTQLRSHKCQYCRAWHLTSKEAETTPTHQLFESFPQRAPLSLRGPFAVVAWFGLAAYRQHTASILSECGPKPNWPKSHIPVTPFHRPYRVRVGIPCGLPVIQSQSSM